MPFFADVHPDGEMPAAVLLAILRAARTGQQGRAGVRPVEYYVGAGGRITCVVEAPSASDVRQFHGGAGAEVPARAAGGAPERAALGGRHTEGKRKERLKATAC